MVVVDDSDQNVTGRDAQWEKLKQELPDACKNGDLDIIQDFIDSGNDVDTILISNYSLLHFAASYANRKVINFLLQVGAKLNNCIDGYTPLMSLCNATHDTGEDGLECLKLLLESGASANAKSRFKETPLMQACSSRKSKEFIEELLKHVNEGINDQDTDGRTALFYAVRNNEIEVAKLLIEHGADPLLTNDNGITVKEVARAKGYLDMLEFLDEQNQEEEEEFIGTSIHSTWDDLFVNLAKSDPNTLDPDVEILLHGMGLDYYKFCFKGVNLLKFLELQNDDLKHLGVDISVHRRRFLLRREMMFEKRWNPLALGEFGKKKSFSLFDTTLALGNVNRQLATMTAGFQHLRQKIEILRREEEKMSAEEKHKIRREIQEMKQKAVNIKVSLLKLIDTARELQKETAGKKLPIFIEKKVTKMNYSWLFTLLAVSMAGFYFCRTRATNVTNWKSALTLMFYKNS